ncbi:MAG TPA: DUF2784 domain-containing protein [Nitrospira sp.]|nr:DUF2784 domain-containing protein [Nitrospira sp.]
MWYVLLADVVAVVHLLFVLFVIFGSLFVIRWPRLAWIHAPALVWGLWVEFAGGICPLTPLESRLRVLGGETGYPEDFLSHWLQTVLYPPGLTRGLQIALGTSLLLWNLGFYLWIGKRQLNRSAARSRST